jgi:hypothetical protein
MPTTVHLIQPIPTPPARRDGSCAVDLAAKEYTVVSAGISTGDKIIMNMTIGRSITSSTFFREADGGICIFNSPRNVARLAPG